jgi:hypothetical protein
MICHTIYLVIIIILDLINETPLSVRVHGVPDRGINKRFICGAIWLNNNYLTSLQGLNKSIEELLELPAYLTWIDISHNEFKNIGQVQLNAR